LKPIDVVIAHGSDHGALHLARHLASHPPGRNVLLLRPERERMLESPDHWLPLLVELDDAPGLPAASMLELKSEFSDISVLSDQLLACI
jgi:hypothetical protein